MRLSEEQLKLAAENYIEETYESELPPDCISYDPNITSALLKYLKDTFKAGYKLADSEDRWIACVADLPDFDVPVLVHFELGGKYKEVVCVLKEGVIEHYWKFHLELRTQKLDEISHWMPLPPPPKQTETAK